MKTGILTYHHTKNYGSWLQTYALYKKLKELGVDIEVIDYRCLAIEKREKPEDFHFKRNIKELAKDFIYIRPLRQLYHRFEKFTEQYLELSSVEYTAETINSSNDEYDNFLIGSDIVWGTHISGGDLTYFLNFAGEEKGKYAYAASIGEKWEKSEWQEISRLLHRFNSIAVREAQSAQWIKEICNLETDVVCDPTMLLTKLDWEAFSGPRRIKEKYILVYFMDRDGVIVQDAVMLGKRLNLPVYYVGFTNKLKEVKPYMIKDPADFVSVIKNAEITFCGSYHGMLFSLYMNTPFYYYYKHSSSRMEYIAKTLEVTERFGLNNSFQNPYDMDFEAINAKIKKMRNIGVMKLKSYNL